MGISATIAAITEAISTTVAAGATALGASAATAGVIGTIGAGAIEGAGLGATFSAATGKDPGQGALFGAISGGTLSGAGPVLGSALGSSAAGDILAGAAGGTLGAAATGQDLGSGTLSGGLSGLISTGLAGNLTPNAPGAVSASGAPVQAASPGGLPSGGGVATAAGSAAPASISGPGPDLTSGVETIHVTGTPTGPSASGLGGLNLASVAPEASALSGGGSPSQATSSTPGDVDKGAAAGGTPPLSGGTPSLASGTNAPSGAQLAPAGSQIGAATSPITSGAAPQVGAGAGPSTSIGKFIDNPSLSTGWDALSANALPILAGGALLSDVATGNKALPGGQPQAALQTQAQQDVAQGAQLKSYLASGLLPPGAQAGLTSATSAAEASVRQQYANRGMSGSSAEAQDLQNVRNTAAAQSFQMASTLFQQGVQESQLGSQIYDEIMKINMQQDQNLSNGVTSFATALAGLNRPIQINTSGVTG